MNKDIRIVEIKEEILSDNINQANDIRQDMKKKNILMINIMASPGAGKTSLILNIIRELKDRFRIAVIEADIDSTVDSEKIMQSGVEAIQMKTGGACHVDSTMMKMALDNLDTKELDLIILENVGNLVCPAEFDTGANLNIMLLSCPEGDDKPLKYPLMFSTSHALVLNKIDLLPHLDFKSDLFWKRAQKLNTDLKTFEVSCKTGEGIDKLIDFLKNELRQVSV